MLLTRSPLSPVPKDWFSLDLHVLSAPPAFVLSQDQTLREEGSPAPKNRRHFHFELSLKGRDPKGHDEVFCPLPAEGWSRSRRKRSLLSFQRPGRLNGVKKAPTRAEGLRIIEILDSESL